MSGPARLPPDPCLPGLAVALDPDAFRAELRARLPECRAGAEPVDVVPMDVQYRPGQDATLLVKVKLVGGPSGKTLRPLFFVHVRPLDAQPPPVDETALASYRARRARRNTGPQSAVEDPVQHWTDLGLHVHAFPMDPRLPSLGDVLDPETMRSALHRAWQPRRVRVRRVDIKLLAYTPESRAALRYDVLSEDKDTGVPELRRLVGKLQRRRSPATLFAGHWAAWRATFGRVSIAPPVGYVATAGLALQEFLDARRLSDLAGQGSFVKHVRAAARSIAEVNRTVLPLPAVRDASKECRTVERWVAVLSRLRPALRQRLEAHGTLLKAELEGRFRARGTVHADFHLANVMVAPGGVTLIDWDQVAHGDPALDPGRFLGALRVAALRVTGQPEGLAEAGDTFLEAYLRRSGEDERQVRLYESVALLIASASPFRLQRAGWQEHADLLVAASQDALARAVRGPALPVTAPSPRPFPLATRRAWALDRAHAQSLLVPILRERHGDALEVTECEGKVAEATAELLHVRWNVKGWLGAERWRTQVEGLGTEGHTGTALLRRLEAVHEALAASPRALTLPKPLGHLAATSLVAVERAPGRSLARQLGDENAGTLLTRLGEALGLLARVSVDLDKRRDAGREGFAVAKRIDRLQEAGHPLAGRLRALLAEALARAAEGEQLFAPTPYPLQLSDILLDEGRVTLKIVRDVVAAPPGAAAAAILSQLLSASLRGDGGDGAPDALRAAFLDAAGMTAAELAPMEALLLLRRACRRLLSHPKDERARALLDEATTRLAAGA